MTEGSFSPLLSSVLHLWCCCSNSQFPSPVSHSPDPSVILFLVPFSFTFLHHLPQKADTSTQTYTQSHAIIVYSLKARKEPFSPNVSFITFLCFYLLFGYGFSIVEMEWHLLSPPSLLSTVLLRTRVPHTPWMEDKTGWEGWQGTWFDQCPPPA